MCWCAKAAAAMPVPDSLPRCTVSAESCVECTAAGCSIATGSGVAVGAHRRTVQVSWCVQIATFLSMQRHVRLQWMRAATASERTCRGLALECCAAMRCALTGRGRPRGRGAGRRLVAQQGKVHAGEPGVLHDLCRPGHGAQPLPRVLRRVQKGSVGADVGEHSWGCHCTTASCSCLGSSPSAGLTVRGSASQRNVLIASSHAACGPVPTL